MNGMIEQMFDCDVPTGWVSAAHHGIAHSLDPVPEWDDTERAALVALLRERPERLTWPEIAAGVSERGSARELWEQLTPPDLFDHDSGPLAEAARMIQEWRATGVRFLAFLDDAYPAQLREIHEMPPVLFHSGTLLPHGPAVSVVGSRAASARGLEIAGTIARDLVDRGISVISGLAKGIDTAAHTAALEAGGRTIAVIGTGINRYYPAENRDLQQRIERDGLVLSQFWPDAPPRAHQFPMRNAVMSGYGRATIVVEAGEKSGARIQARQAVAHGRPVILTDLVVRANAWARTLIDRPGVHVADSTRAAMALVEELVSQRDEVDQLVAEVLASRE